MTVDIKLCKKRTTYTTESGAERRTFNLFVKVGTEYIPIDVCFFPNAKCEGRDPSYPGRRAVLEALSELIPATQRESVRTDEADEARGEQ